MKNKNIVASRRPLVLVAASALFLSGARTEVRAADPPVEPQAIPGAVDLEVFRGVHVLRIPSSLAYPASERRNGKEGWVELNMMIDPHGKPYEVTVLDSSGSGGFEQAAVKALDQIVFEPAKSGATPIDSSFNVKLVFSFKTPAKGASSEFITAYKGFTKAVEAGDKRQADELLTKLQVQNLYEDAFRSFGKYFYDRNWGTAEDQLTDLGRAAAGEKSDRYLPKEAFTMVLTAKFILEVDSRDYGSALETWRTLQPIAALKTRADLQRTVDQIDAIRKSDEVVSLAEQIRKGTTWGGHLFKTHFSIAVASGAVSEIKLRCERQYLFFKYQPGVQYSVSTRSGSCGIEVVGAPGTTFELIQS
jgi:TonB family protein